MVDPRLRDQGDVDPERGQPLDAGAQLGGGAGERRRAPPPPTPGKAPGRRAPGGSSWSPWQPADASLRVGDAGGFFPLATYRTLDRPPARVRRSARRARRRSAASRASPRVSSSRSSTTVTAPVLRISTANGRTIPSRARAQRAGAAGAGGRHGNEEAQVERAPQDPGRRRRGESYRPDRARLALRTVRGRRRPHGQGRAPGVAGLPARSRRARRDAARHRRLRGRAPHRRRNRPRRRCCSSRPATAPTTRCAA